MAYRTGNLSLSLVRSTQRELLHTVERVTYRSVSVLAGHKRRIAGVPRSQTTIQRRQETTSVATDEATFNERKRKERFIPVARRTLIQSMMNEENLLSGKERACVEAFATSLDAVVAQRYYRLMEEVKVCWPPWCVVVCVCVCVCVCCVRVFVYTCWFVSVIPTRPAPLFTMR